MTWPYKFPHPADVIAADAERFRSLTVEERWREVLEMAELANRMVHDSPKRADLESVANNQEEAWATAQSRIVKDYERRRTNS